MSPRKMLEQDRKRFTLWLPTATADELERLQTVMGKASIAEVVRDAIDVYTSLLKARDRGVRLYFEDDETGEEGRIWLLPGPPPA
jgi:hypothetical protein